MFGKVKYVRNKDKEKRNLVLKFYKDAAEFVEYGQTEWRHFRFVDLSFFESLNVSQKPFVSFRNAHYFIFVHHLDMQMNWMTWILKRSKQFRSVQLADAFIISVVIWVIDERDYPSVIFETCFRSMAIKRQLADRRKVMHFGSNSICFIYREFDREWICVTLELQNRTYTVGVFEFWKHSSALVCRRSRELVAYWVFAQTIKL